MGLHYSPQRLLWGLGLESESSLRAGPLSGLRPCGLAKGNHSHSCFAFSSCCFSLDSLVPVRIPAGIIHTTV